MSKKIPIGGRLREERKRLRLNQDSFADVAGVSRKTLFSYETGDTAPPADALASWADKGLDVLYVVVGDETGDQPPPTLPPDEELLLEAYRALKPAARKKLLASLLTGGKSGLDSKRDGVNVTGSKNRIAGRDYHEGE